MHPQAPGKGPVQLPQCRAAGRPPVITNSNPASPMISPDRPPSRPGFRPSTRFDNWAMYSRCRLRRMTDDLALRVCSMGMSGDFELAIAEGATMVRVGTAIFGPRPGRADARR